EGTIRHCVSDIGLSVALWVRRPNDYPDIPRKLLISETFAALNATPEMWAKYITAIERQRDQGTIDDQQVKSLVYSYEAREHLISITHGNPEGVTDETPLQVLRAYEDRIREPVVEERKEAERERDALRAEVDALTGWRDRTDKRRRIAVRTALS